MILMLIYFEVNNFPFKYSCFELCFCSERIFFNHNFIRKEDENNLQTKRFMSRKIVTEFLYIISYSNNKSLLD